MSTGSRRVAHGSAERFEIVNSHLLILARRDDATRAGLECLSRSLVDAIRIVARTARHVVADIEGIARLLAGE